MAPASKSPPQAVYLLPLASLQSLPDPHTHDFHRFPFPGNILCNILQLAMTPLLKNHNIFEKNP